MIEDEEHGGKRRVKGEKGGAGVQVDAEDMVQKEAQRLEVMKRRQERELNQMVAYELMRKEMQVILPLVGSQQFQSALGIITIQTGFTKSESAAVKTRTVSGFVI